LPVNGFYHATKVEGYDDRVLLGEKVFDVPTGWTCPSGDMATAFGRLRFPDCPGILGRVAISAITDETLCHLTIESSPCLATKLTASPPSSEQVDFCAEDMTILAENVAVTRVGDTEFTVPNSGATAHASIAAAKFIIATGTKYYWDDEMPKHNIVTLEWYFDYRLLGEALRINGIIDACISGCNCSTMGERKTVPSEYSDFIQTQLCVPWTQCSPKVVRTLDFPATFPLDSQYGSRWQAVVASAVFDLLWQPPHHPPRVWNELLDDWDAIPAWAMDNGTCLENVVNGETGATTIAYYPMPPLVEPFLYLPMAGMSGTEPAPALPTGITVGFLSPVDHTGSGVAFAPYPGNAGGAGNYGKPWEIHQSMCICVAGAGRFASDYAKFTLNCE
jgi:hypothetical protein